MNVIEVMNTVNKIGKYVLTVVLAVNLIGVLSAADELTGINTAMSELCTTAIAFLGISIALMIILAGAVYAFGQIMGAETRARATVWATAMLTGAIIGALIYLIVPFIIGKIVSPSGAWSANKPCEFTIGK